MTTILICDDHHLVRHGLCALVATQPDLLLVGEASDGQDAVEKVKRLKPEILLLDLMIPRLHGLEVLKRVRNFTKVIIVSMNSEEPYVTEGLQRGAMGYVIKDSSSDELLQSIQKVKAGERYLSPRLSNRTLRRIIDLSSHGDPFHDPYDGLSTRERLVLEFMAEGLTSEEVGARLFISPRTAESHRANIMRKLHLKTQTDIVKFAIRRNLISI
ncbi:MAG: two component transcriptional regulator, LuxR family [Verrucomicrobiales bacterium]|nr:two component transcriptional regulator, LuxR family [Verrucomicrobiales bacterium]